VYITQKSDAEVSNSDPGFDNMAIALSYGFAVLIPTINPSEYSFQHQPYASLPRDVLPAAQAAIDTGIADGRRIYLFGHSYGAYSVYSLVEQSDIFAAAAAINGPSNLLTEYLDLDPNLRYEPWAFEVPAAQAELETAHRVMSLGDVPWRAFDKYIENSPIRYVDRIHTPLLIFHSDTDVFDMHQADDMFAGLKRLGKEVRYVRFWGEPHSLDSLANIRQFWSEMISNSMNIRKLDPSN
jgi:dipeptidyl aminopeptidase/acylaminoacyl peptidase